MNPPPVTVFVVSVEQFYANHFYVEAAFSTRAKAEKYKGDDSDLRITEVKVDAVDVR